MQKFDEIIRRCLSPALEQMFHVKHSQLSWLGIRRVQKRDTRIVA